ncbi:toxin regulator [Salipaludibacillus neizhouensis]|uniref:Toxin regulator n=1 Tax=Salipaludibacillus neizhouensis TaxID=885475 RepID=A0A3A9JZ13_9BACI|nr:toxin regulator [Salipaludibacillus neizhouensis]RKL65429.1 toxin regulator [Salipaludibacillus neizhouensis]
MEKVLGFIKLRWGYILVAFIALIIGGIFGPSQEQVDALDQEKTTLNDTISDTNKQVKALEGELSDINKQVKALEGEKKELEAKVKEAEPFFQLKEAERKEKEAELKKKEEEAKAKKEAEEAAAKAEKEAEEKAKAEEEEKAQAEAKRLAEEEEKRGYDTGITYDQLARNPDNHIFEKVKFHGKVVQVMEGDGITQIRLAANDNYDTMVFAEFESSVVDSRILEDDTITIMGISTGLLTYESTMGGSISIPGVSIEKIER